MESLELSNQQGIKQYFEKVCQLHDGGQEFPIAWDLVWPLVYTRKSTAVEYLKQNFIEGIDYQVLQQNLQNLNNGGRPSIEYRISTACLEFSIARKVPAVFECYRQVFHRARKNIQSLPNFEDPIAAAEAWIEKFKELKTAEGKIEVQQQQISQLEPIAQIGKNLDFKEGSVTIATFAPTVGMGQNQLFKRLRDEGILISQGERYNEPYADYRHWFDLKPGELNEGPKKGKIWFQTRVSIEGQKALIKRYGKPLELRGKQLKIAS